MPKLIQINTSLNCNSTGRIAEQIGQLVISKGWEAWMVHSGRNANSSIMKTIQTEPKYADYWHILMTRLFDSHGLWSRLATVHLVKQLVIIKPDIIHLHNIHGYYLNYPILFDYLSKSNIPVVWTFHDCWPITGHCTFFERVKCVKWKTGCGNCPYLHDYPRSFFVDRSSKNYKQKKNAFTQLKNLTIVPVSDWLENILKQSFLCGYTTKVIHNGTDLDIFNPQSSNIRTRYGISPEKIVVLGVASVWHERKGLLDFIKLADCEKIQVILVGVSDEVKKKLSRNIIAIKKTNNQQELAELYSGSDIFVNPTYDDNFPTTNIEALACGTPVITYDTGGSPEAVDCETGVVVGKGDIQGIVDAIRLLVNKDRVELQNACRNRAVRLYNKNERFLDYINLYERLLNEKSSSR